MAAWFKFGRGVKASPDNGNRSFLGDGSAYPVWDILGAGHPNQKQIYTIGALGAQPQDISIQGSFPPSGSTATYGAIDNPFVNMGTGLGGSAS